MFDFIYHVFSNIGILINIIEITFNNVQKTALCSVFINA